jgi:hypothetical protein
MTTRQSQKQGEMDVTAAIVVQQVARMPTTDQRETTL